MRVDRIATLASPRQVLDEDFPSVRGKLPIKGGWGYDISDAVIIDKDDERVDPSLPFDGVGIEYIFVEKRIYEELIIFRPEGLKFSGIQWKLLRQSLVAKNERHYDRLEFRVSAFHESDWNMLKGEWEGGSGYGSPNFDVEAHTRKRDALMQIMDSEFWFDITSFFGR